MPVISGGVGATHLVASGFDDICGRLRNSSRSIVPELSWAQLVSTTLTLLAPPPPESNQRTLSNFINRFRSLSTSSRSTIPSVSPLPAHSHTTTTPTSVGGEGPYSSTPGRYCPAPRWWCCPSCLPCAEPGTKPKYINRRSLVRPDGVPSYNRAGELCARGDSRRGWVSRCGCDASTWRCASFSQVAWRESYGSSGVSPQVGRWLAVRCRVPLENNTQLSSAGCNQGRGSGETNSPSGRAQC